MGGWKWRVELGEWVGGGAKGVGVGWRARVGSGFLEGIIFPKTKISRVVYQWKSELVVACCGGGRGVGQILGRVKQGWGEILGVKFPPPNFPKTEFHGWRTGGNRSW